MYILSNTDFVFLQKIAEQYSQEGTLFDSLQTKNRRRKASALTKKMARKEPARTIDTTEE